MTTNHFNFKSGPDAKPAPTPAPTMDLNWYPDAYPGRHLTAAQMDGLLHGDAGQTEADEAVARHLHRCPMCAAELAELRGSIGLLRSAATEFAVRSTPASNAAGQREGIRPESRKTRGSRGTRNLHWLPATLALAASLTVMAALAPISSLIRGPVSPAKPAPSSSAAHVQDHSVADDDALLREIDQQLSASVPTALEPLADPELTANLTPNPTKKD